jgi:hypothetical protein
MPMPEGFEVQNLRPKKPFPTGVAGPGRPRGSKDRVTKDLKREIIEAAAAVGDGDRSGLAAYLQMCATRYPRSYLALLGKIIPLEIATAGGQFIGTINVIGVPSGAHLSAEDISRFEMPAIEHEPASEQAEPAE